MFWFSNIPTTFTLAMLIWLLLFTPHAQPQTKPMPTPPAAVTTTGTGSDDVTPITADRELAPSVVNVSAIEAARQETRMAKLESLILREQLATQQLEKIRADQQSMFSEVCTAAGLTADPKVCQIDLAAHTVTKRADVAPAKK